MQNFVLLMSRFFPAISTLLVTYFEARYYRSDQLILIGLVVSAMVVPQVVDMGHTRRLTLEAGLASEENRELQIQSSFRAFLVLSVLIACAVATFAALTIPSSQTSIPLVVLPCLLAGLSTAISQLGIALLYWRGSRRPFLSLVLDPALLLIFWASLVSQIAPTPTLLAVFLYLRAFLLLMALGYGRQVLRLMMQVRQGFDTVVAEARTFGRLEFQLSVFCFVAWSADPFLYGYFAEQSDVAEHLMATRISQVGINCINIVLIGGLWRSASGPVASKTGAHGLRLLIFLMLCVTIFLAGWGRDFYGVAMPFQATAVYLAVFAATAAAIARQKATLDLLAAGVDMRHGTSLLLVALIVVLKGFAMLSQNVVVLEVASVVASLLYLEKLSRRA